MKKEMNNKGFSLVELIIVIAIMAVLMGVLAPQLLRKVEEAREQADLTTFSEVEEAVKIALAKESVATAVTTDTVSITNGSQVSAGVPALDTELKAIITDNIKVTSKKYSTGATIAISVDADNQYTMTCSWK